MSLILNEYTKVPSPSKALTAYTDLQMIAPIIPRAVAWEQPFVAKSYVPYNTNKHAIAFFTRSSGYASGAYWGNNDPGATLTDPGSGSADWGATASIASVSVTFYMQMGAASYSIDIYQGNNFRGSATYTAPGPGFLWAAGTYTASASTSSTFAADGTEWQVRITANNCPFTVTPLLSVSNIVVTFNSDPILLVNVNQFFTHIAVMGIGLWPDASLLTNTNTFYTHVVHSHHYLTTTFLDQTNAFNLFILFPITLDLSVRHQRQVLLESTSPRVIISASNIFVTASKAATSTDSAFARVKFETDGTTYYSQDVGTPSWTQGPNWFSPTTTGIGGGYDLYMTYTPGLSSTPGVPTGITFNSNLVLSTARTITLTKATGSVGFRDTNLTFIFKNHSNGTVTSNGTGYLYAEWA